MHRSRLSVLVIFAAAAACSKRDASEGSAILSEDRTLVARLDVDQESRKPTLPDACGTIAIPAQPAVSNQHQAEELARQARDAEMHGDVGEARSLLRRATELDATNKSAAYHLGRTSEALGDSAAAMTAYCRYLALTPTTAEAVEAHQRVTQLSKSKTRVAAANARDSSAARQPVSPAATQHVASAPQPATRRVASSTAATRPRVERTTVERATVARTTVTQPAPSRATERTTRVSSTAAPRTEDTPAQRTPGSSTPDVATRDSSAAAGDVVMTTAGTEPTVDQPAPAPRASSRYPSRAQSAGVGAAAGAILGGITGRSVKSAIIGAAAGGILGTAVGGGMRTTPRGIVPWNSSR